MDSQITIFTKGVHNLLNPEVIPLEAAQDAQNWITRDGIIKLANGKVPIGADGVVGEVTGEIFGYKVNGETVHWRKIGATIQYLNGTTWTTTITGLTADADYSFTNYSSLAGAFTFAVGVDGIYKMNNANPGSYISLYDSTKNFKGYAFIDKGRMILWNRPEDKTGLYGSYIDRQNATVYTTVTDEVIGSGDGIDTTFAGTLAFKGGGATRNCFGISVAVTGGETFTDNFNGVLTGSAGGTGTINYTTGAWTLTFVVPPASAANNIKATYQWEDSNIHSVTDFTKSATRLAGEGFVFPQDEGGDAILNVLIGSDGYYSMKSHSAYRLAIDADDLGATNEVYRKEIGIPSFRGAISTTKGIVFLNTAKPEKPELTILQKNLTGDAIEPVVLVPQFQFANYAYDDLTMDIYDQYVILACRTSTNLVNNVVLLCDIALGTVDITYYQVRTFARDNGELYAGSSVTQTVYNLYNGYDDDGFPLENFYRTKDELFDTDRLKKYRKIRLKGLIDPDQSYEVYANYDDSGDQLVGTVLGSGSYVDYTSPQAIGSNMVGASQVGGDDVVNIYPYFMEIRLKKVPKFRKRNLKFVALGIGFVSINYIQDWDIMTYEQKIPTRFRQKQNVNLGGNLTDQPLPDF